MLLRQIGMLSIAILGVILSACTRPQGDVSKVTLSIPLSLQKNASQSITKQSGTLNYVAINVGGDDKPPLFCSWDIEENRTSGPCQFSQTSVFLPEVDNGPSRMIQVLMVYSESSGSSMTFKYGDRVVSLPTPESVVISPEAIGGVQNGGHLKGRFLSSASSGPSGLVNVRFSPGSGKPSMIIQQVEMYSGWFQAFSLETTSLDYLLDGKSIFGGPKNKAEFNVIAGNSAGAVILQTDASGYEVWGFFGDAASTAGKSATSGACSAGTEFLSCLSVNSKFAGPFKADSTGRLLSVVAGPPNKLEWKLLPGIDASVMDGVSVYSALADLSADDLQKVVMSRGFNCDGFSKTANVSLLGEIAVGISQEISTGATLHVPNPLRPLAVCPRQNGFLKTAALVSPKLDNDGGCSDCKYLRLEISNYAESTGDKYIVGKNGCYPMSIGAYRGQGTSSSDHTSSITLTAPDPGWAHFYSDPSCASQLGSAAFTIAAGVSGATGSVWIKPVASGNAKEIAGTISSDPMDGFIRYQQQYNQIDVVSPVTKLEIPSGNILANVCYQGSTKLVMPNGYDIPGLGGSVNDNLTGSSLARFGSNASECAASVSGALPQSMTGNPLQSQFWFRLTTAGSENITATPTSFDASIATATAVSSSEKDPIQIKITEVNPLVMGKCNAIRLELVNKDGQIVPAPAAMQIALPVLGNLGYWAMNKDCSGVVENVSLAMNDSVVVLYMFATSDAGGSFTITSNTGASSSLWTPSVSVNASKPWIKVISKPVLPKGSGAIGSHNFPMTVGLAVSSGATLKCAVGSSPPAANSGSWGTCGGRLSGSILSYNSQAELSPSASSNVNLMAVSGYDVAILTLSKDAVVGIGGLTVQTCDSAPAGATFDDINAAFSGNVVCLSATTFSKGAGTADSISIPAGKHLLGKINTATGAPATNIVVTNASAGVRVQSLSSSSYISSIRFDMNGSTGTRYGIRANDGGVSTVYSYGNEFDSSLSASGNVIGIALDSGAGSSSTLYSSGDLFKIKAVAGGGISKGIYLTPSGNTTTIQFSKFYYASGDASNGSIGLSIAAPVSGSASLINIMNSSFTGDGAGIQAYGQTSAGGPIDVNIQRSIIESGSTSFAMAYPIFIQDNVGTQISESRFKNEVPGKAVMKYFQSAAGGAYSGSGSNFLRLERNVFHQHAASPVLYVGSSSLDLTSSREVTLEANHFVNMGGGLGQIAISGNTSTYPIAVVRNSGSPGHGFNMACSNGSGNAWSNFYGGTSSIASTSYQFSPPSTSTSMYGGLCAFVP